MFRRLDCLRRTQRFYSLNNTVFGRESFAGRHIGPNDVEQQQMLKELGYQVLILLLTNLSMYNSICINLNKK